MLYKKQVWAFSSAAERFVHIEEVTGSTPVMPTMKKKYATDKKSLECDTKLEFLRGSGPGGQRRNRRETSVRLTHLPSGFVVLADELASQAANRKVAFQRLKEHLQKLNRPRKRRIPTIPPPSVEEKRIRTKHWKTRKKELRKPPRLET